MAWEAAGGVEAAGAVPPPAGLVFVEEPGEAPEGGPTRPGAPCWFAIGAPSGPRVWPGAAVAPDAAEAAAPVPGADALVGSSLLAPAAGCTSKGSLPVTMRPSICAVHTACHTPVGASAATSKSKR
ncbi:MAG TPA: hypothetical protein VHJ78_03650 [Actinomycetota bacterium]|nr:hypothetical protein [Actinomycetota bacterium]